MSLITIGKDPSNNIKLDDLSVSRFHMQLYIKDENTIIAIDLGSTNGTYINGNKITQPTQLNFLDILKVGNKLINWQQYIIEQEDAEIAQQINEAIEAETKKNNISNIIIGILILIFVAIIAYQLFK